MSDIVKAIVAGRSYMVMAGHGCPPVQEQIENATQAALHQLRTEASNGRRAASQRDLLADALDDLLEWAEKPEGEARLRRIDALAKARRVLAESVDQDWLARQRAERQGAAS